MSLIILIDILNSFVGHKHNAIIKFGIIKQIKSLANKRAMLPTGINEHIIAVAAPAKITIMV